MVLGKRSPRTKSAFIFLRPVIFLFHVRYFEHVFGATRFYVTNYSLFLGEFRVSFNFRSQFLKFGVMDNYSNGFAKRLVQFDG